MSEFGKQEPTSYANTYRYLFEEGKFSEGKWCDILDHFFIGNDEYIRTKDEILLVLNYKFR